MVLATETQGTSASHAATHKACSCERNWCPVCRLPTCRPSRDTKWAKDTLNTTYLKDFDGKKAPKDIRKAPNDLVPSVGAFNGETTQRADYGPKKATAHRPDRAAHNLIHRPFDGSTTYNHFHNGKRGPASDGRAPPALAQSAPFAGISTHNADYIDHGPARHAYTAPAWNIPKVPFDGSSTYQDDFIKKAMPPQDPRLPAPLLQSQNLDNYTTYGTDFVEHPLNQASGQCCDHPHHPAHHVHVHDVATLRPTGEVLGNTTGRRYKLR